MTLTDIGLAELQPQELAERLKALNVNKTVASGDTMFRAETPDAYFNVGRSGLRIVWSAISARLGYFEGDQPIREILDFGAGYGRVTRFLRAGFPNATVTATDMDEAGPAWCAENLQVEHLPSDQSLPDGKYDLIFLGSVFTHLDKSIIARIIPKLFAALAPNGLLIFSTQGRYARADVEANPTTSYRLSLDSIHKLMKEYDETGYGYADYAPGRNYGISMINPSWMINHMAAQSRLVLAMFQEKGFDNHQDIYAFIRAPIGQKRKSGL